jgi:putative membrane protein
MNDRQFYSMLLGSMLLVFIWSLIAPKDYFTWFLEVAPVIIGVVLLRVTYARFQFSRLAYLFLWLHAMILMVGGHYTYAEVPLFNTLRDTFDLTRNHYDRVGHLAQGFFPAILTREILLRNSPLQQGKWLFFLVVCVCLAFSAFYELIEWCVAAGSGTAADAFLGTQGDIWDTQWDMALALFGAITSQLLFAKRHDSSMGKVIRPE